MPADLRRPGACSRESTLRAAWQFTPSQLAEIARAWDLATAPEQTASAGAGGGNPHQEGRQCTADADRAGALAASPSEDAARAALIDAVVPAPLRELPIVWVHGVLPAGVDVEWVAAAVRDHCVRNGMPMGDRNDGDPVPAHGARAVVVVLATGATNVAPVDADPLPGRPDAASHRQRQPGAAARGASQSAQTRSKGLVEAPYPTGRLSAALFDLVNSTGVHRNG